MTARFRQFNTTFIRESSLSAAELLEDFNHPGANRLYLIQAYYRDILKSTWRENALRSPFQRSANFIGLPASSSRAGHEPTPCDRGVISPLFPQRAAPRGKQRAMSAARQ